MNRRVRMVVAHAILTAPEDGEAVFVVPFQEF